VGAFGIKCLFIDRATLPACGWSVKVDREGVPADVIARPIAERGYCRRRVDQLIIQWWRRLHAADRSRVRVEGLEIGAEREHHAVQLIHAGERAVGVFAKEEAHSLTGKTANAILRQPQPARAPYRLSRESVFFGDPPQFVGLQVIVGHTHLDALLR
jgi:hypothetical protein